MFYRPEKGIRTYVHGDDYVSIGKIDHLKWMRTRLENKYTIKTELLGPDEGNQLQLKILKKIVTWDHNNGIKYEANPRHVEILLKQLQMIEAKSVTTPRTKEEGTTNEDNENLLSDADATTHIALVARCKYLSPDRPGIVFAGKELARGMAKPIVGDMQRLKRLARYLQGKPRLV